jgi:CBS domain-containing protein
MASGQGLSFEHTGGNHKLLRLGIANAPDLGKIRGQEEPHYPMDTPVAALIERKGSAVHAVASTITVAEAVAEMNKKRIGCIVIVDDGRIAGIFTERDVLRRVVGADVDPKTTLVGAVMTRNVHTIPPEATVEQTMALFAERRCRHIPVVDHGRLSGLISIGDISRWVADTHKAEADHLKNYIAGGFHA